MQTIQWFPGHMAKARREILEKIKLVDLIIELKDARIPFSSTNPMINEIVGKKPRLILLCKSSVCDKRVTEQWINFYKENGVLALDIDSITNYNVSKIPEYARLALKDLFETRKNKGIRSNLIKAMVLGIPNVGKSTLINTLAKRKAAKVGDRPGVTKSQTWIKVNDDFLLLDTPGILWPKFDNQTVGLHLAMCGSIKDDIISLEGVAFEAVNYITKHYPTYLKQRYGLEDTNLEPEEILKQIGKKRGLLVKGGEVDLSRVTVVFMNELRGMKIGAMSYEKPEDIAQLI